MNQETQEIFLNCKEQGYVKVFDFLDAYMIVTKHNIDLKEESKS